MIKQRPVRNVCRIVAGVVLVTMCWSAPVCSAEDKMACGDEIEKFCSEIKPGQLSITMCLDAKRAELSVACRDKVDKSLAKIAQAKQICEADIQKFCAEVKPGEGRVLDCMVANRLQLTADCRQQVDKYSAARAAAPQSRPEGK